MTDCVHKNSTEKIHQLATVTNDTSMVDISFDTYNSERINDEIYDDSTPFTNDTDMVDEGRHKLDEVL